ncbi:hypothetical protein C8Q74DRAFT_1248412 [Fomes fomentarius]|nr:hypothetical protein C8Q74DRAFT_1248412 [Fomes fomentarius]
MSSYATLADLPIELLVKIVKLVPQDDLCTHIWFYQSSPAAAATYDFVGDGFWKDACLDSGLGFVPQLDKEDSETCWRDIVMDCVKHDAACKRSECGLSLLRTNRKLVALPRRHDQVKTHDALQGITFEDVPWIKDILRDTRLRMDTRAHRAYAINNPVHLGCHPMAYRSFATFPPQEQLRVERIGFKFYKESNRMIPVENKFGVTVYDVIRTIYDW